MPARPTWKGYLKISLVTIPIKVFPATDAGATISFNQLHAECQTRIQQKRWCPHCQREVPNTDIVKGYEFEKGRYVVMDEEDIEKVRVDRRASSTSRSSPTTRRSIRSISSALLPRAGRTGGEGSVRGHSRRHEGQGGHRQGGAVRPRVSGQGAAARARPDHVHAAARERDPQHGRHRRARRTCRRRSRPTEVKLARQVMGTFEGEVDFKSYRDEYQEGLRADHRREDRGPGNRRARGRGAAEGRQPDGGAAKEPRFDQRIEEEASAHRGEARGQGKKTSPGLDDGDATRTGQRSPDCRQPSRRCRRGCSLLVFADSLRLRRHHPARAASGKPPAS